LTLAYTQFDNFQFQAVYSRDSFARALYGRLFTWLVAEINTILISKTNEKKSVIGVLDIYGFEVLQVAMMAV
jgi:myosin-1